MIIIKISLIAILSFLLTLFLPWYLPFIVCFLVGLLLSNKPGNNFIAGALGVGIFWLIYTLYLDFNNQHILSHKIAQLFSESLQTNISSGILIAITVLIGVLLGGLSALSGAMIMHDETTQRLQKSVKTKRYKLNLK